jgi:hypothetical protein
VIEIVLAERLGVPLPLVAGYHAVVVGIHRAKSHLFTRISGLSVITAIAASRVLRKRECRQHDGAEHDGRDGSCLLHRFLLRDTHGRLRD